MDGADQDVIVIFHDLKGYDGMFILQHCYTKRQEVMDQIIVGTNILSLRSDRLTFKDSLCFLPFPLANFPAPSESLNCVMFLPSQIQHARKPTLRRTHATQRNVWSRWHVCLKESWIRMLVSREGWWQLPLCHATRNASLLQIRCQTPQSRMKKVLWRVQATCRLWPHWSVSPFLPFAIASAAKKPIPINTIASQPPWGWHGSRSNQSIKALKWLAWCAHQTSLPLTVRNRGEVCIANHLMDGFDPCDPITHCPTVYEFHGCLWHRCPCCFPKNWDRFPIAHADRTMEEVYESKLQKHELLKKCSYNVKVQWGCDWDTEVKTNQDLQQFLSAFEITEPLQPTDAFFGGRTNAVKLHYTTALEEKIHYSDITSLYPWVNKNREYPTEHPDIIIDLEDQDIHHYFGMAKVDVLPPYELYMYHSVLLYRHCGKLTIPLCKSCVKDEMPKKLLDKSHCCSHTPEQWQLHGTWCTPEFVKAI